MILYILCKVTTLFADSKIKTNISDNIFIAKPSGGYPHPTIQPSKPTYM